MIYISLGSNIGNKLTNLKKAKILLQKFVKINLESIAIETEAILREDSPDSWNIPYLNMIVAGTTIFSPEGLLVKLKDIEKSLGRKDNGLWSPRIIDLDILLFNDQIIESDNLRIPHMELFNRPFLLQLLVMIGKVNLKIPDRSIELQEYLHKYQFSSKRCFDISAPSIVGIVNVTNDSFSDGGKNFNRIDAIKTIKNMIRDGAEIIDIGAQSTNPNCLDIVGSEEEYNRIAPILDDLKNIDTPISIDTYQPNSIKKILDNYNIQWINDVSGRLDNDTLKYIASSKCKILTTHSLSIPPRKDAVLDHNKDPIEEIKIWIEKIVEKLYFCGFSDKDIIIDPGIGFGKSYFQNLNIIKNIGSIKSFLPKDIRLLVGHSRKSFITSFYNSRPEDRDIETISISSNLKDKNVDFIRVHNVVDHHRLFVADKLSK